MKVVVVVSACSPPTRSGCHGATGNWCKTSNLDNQMGLKKSKHLLTVHHMRPGAQRCLTLGLDLTQEWNCTGGPTLSLN